MADNDAFNGLTPQEQRIAALIKEEAIPPIFSEDIGRACQAASSYLNQRQHPFDAGFWCAVFSAMTASSALCWIIGALALGIGARVAVASFTNFNPMALLFALSPVPIITLAIRELSYRDENLSQMERTCKYAPSHIYFARLWIGVLVNAVAVTVLGTFLISFDVSATRIWLCSFIAMFLIGAVTLLVMSYLDHALPLSVLMAVWIVCSAFAISQDEVIWALDQLSNGVLIAAILSSIAIFLGSTIGASKRLYA